jgi:hypothetical protein
MLCSRPQATARHSTDRFFIPSPLMLKENNKAVVKNISLCLQLVSLSTVIFFTKTEQSRYCC